MELTLRANGPRIITLRRSTPLESAVWTQGNRGFARSSTEALHSFYVYGVSDRPKALESKPEKSKPRKKSTSPE